VTAEGDYTPAPPADFVLPFDLPRIGLRGRLVRLDAVSTRALAAHPLPEEAQRVLAEALTLSVLLGSVLKLEGRLSVQTKGDGPLSLAVADFFAGGGVRGYARLDEERYAALEPPKRNFAGLVGEGVLAITIEPKLGAPSYQGLVQLSADSLAASAETYFVQSEQLPTMLKLAAGTIYRSGEGSGWRSAGLMVQAVPGKVSDDVRETDDWQRVALFLQTLEPYELLDTSLAAETVLWRLFHEDEIRVHAAQPLSFECTCNADKVLPVLTSYPAEELPTLADPDGVVRARCEFCGNTYEFPLAELAQQKAKSSE
jgi:molecular chaperone Hsp33